METLVWVVPALLGSNVFSALIAGAYSRRAQKADATRDISEAWSKLVSPMEARLSHLEHEQEQWEADKAAWCSDRASWEAERDQLRAEMAQASQGAERRVRRVLASLNRAIAHIEDLRAYIWANIPGAQPPPTPDFDLDEGQVINP